MKCEDVVPVIWNIAAVMEENCGYLSELDARNGDGDLGISMKNGFRAAAEAMEKENTKDLGLLFLAGAKALNLAAPSTLGTILSVCMMGIAKDLKGKEEAGLGELADSMESGLKLVMERAGSRPGEKTILDAVVPALEALRKGATETLKREKAWEPAEKSLETQKIWKLALEAAEEGMWGTASMRPKHGRAAYYGDKSVGLVDGGAVAGMLIFKAISEISG